MNTNMDSFPTFRNIDLDLEKLKIFLVRHLNMIHCAKSHLLERLPEIADFANFLDLKHAIAETIEDVAKQLSRIDEIFFLLNSYSTIVECSGQVGLVDDAFGAIQQQGSNFEISDLFC